MNPSPTPTVFGMTIRFRRKLTIVAVVTMVFLAMWWVVAGLLGIPFERSVWGAAVLGFGYGLYEEFYVQTPRSTWLRRFGALFEIGLNIVVLTLILLVVMNINHLITGRFAQIDVAYRKLPVVLPVLVMFSAAMVTLLRVISFIGGRNLLRLMVGKYRRPVLEHQVLLFLDMRDSTQLAERLGPLATRELIGQVFYDLSEPIVNYGGDIYRFTGDGMVATFKITSKDIHDAARFDYLVDLVDAMEFVLERTAHDYLSRYDHAPKFRYAYHGGDIVVAEEGDSRRAIGYYGETIHIAARLESEAKTRDCLLLISDFIRAGIDRHADRFISLGACALKGISREVELYALVPGKNQATLQRQSA
ncbi:MAG: hypothetical protein DHS20C01_29410 [marine bacterium B5-7]|nr:MAG: hypothetical protein DHS20C01_29410 [marine bacterium B5-7]